MEAPNLGFVSNANTGVSLVGTTMLILWRRRFAGQ
jgi:hypothetical protein